MAFETGTIRRVTKSDHNKLRKSLEALKEHSDEHKLNFLIENSDAILDSFRWPSVKRMDDTEKAVVARNTLLAATDNNEQLVDWILGNKDMILSAYEAGIEKRQINEKAANALAEYRAKKAAEKAEKAAKEATAA